MQAAQEMIEANKLKKRFVWPESLHRDFVSAVFDIGLKNSTSKLLLQMLPQSRKISTGLYYSPLFFYTTTAPLFSVFHDRQIIFTHECFACTFRFQPPSHVCLLNIMSTCWDKATCVIRVIFFAFSIFFLYFRFFFCDFFFSLNFTTTFHDTLSSHYQWSHLLFMAHYPHIVSVLTCLWKFNLYVSLIFHHFTISCTVSWLTGALVCRVFVDYSASQRTSSYPSHYNIPRRKISNGLLYFRQISVFWKISHFTSVENLKSHLQKFRIHRDRSRGDYTSYYEMSTRQSEGKSGI